jgi:GT2 family glycosyltransferase
MQLSVIILNYNVRFFLEQCILSVQKALENFDGEIIVVDNNSSDDSCEMIKTLFPNVRLIENKVNFGFPKGNNIGVEMAIGEYICILNPDTVVAEDSFTKILNKKNWQLNTGIIGCKLIDGTGNFLPESKRGIPTPWVAVTKVFGFYKIFPKSSFFNQYYAQHLNEKQSGKVSVFVGAFMVMKKELYKEIHGFDEAFFMYGEDIDLCFRVLKSGKTNYYFAETSVIHYKGESTAKDLKYLNRFREAMLIFYKKHFNQSFLFDFIMKIGAFAFSLFKKNQSKKTTKIVDEYILFSKNNLELKLSKKVSILDNFSHFKNDFTKNIEIIFDTKSFSFQEIITFMETYKNKNITFKNYIQDSDFMIGSDNANEKGQMIAIKN